MTDKQMISKANDKAEGIAEAKPLRRLTPAVDSYETVDEVVLLADLPGVDEQALRIEFADGVLTLEAPIDTENENEQQTYYRQFKLSGRLDVDAGEAALRDGVMTLRLPKREEARPKKIAVRTLH